jgi:uncharacterized membrane protein
VLKKSSVILFFLGLSMVLAYVYTTYRTPEGITPMGGEQEVIAWVSLFTAVVSFMTALAGLFEKLLDKKS